MLNLGDSWSYEYRILRTNSSKRPYLREEDAQEKSKKDSQENSDKNLHGVIYRKREELITRDKEKDNAGEVHEDSVHDSKNEYDEETAIDEEIEVGRRRDEEIAHYNDKTPRQKDGEVARIQRDAEHLRLAERVLRNEADRLRKEVLSSMINQRQGQDQGAQIHYIHNPKKHKMVAKTETRISKLSKHLKTESVGTTETRMPPKRSKQTIESVATNEATTEDSNSNENHNSDNLKKAPMKINDDNVTENLKKVLRNLTDYSDTHYTHSNANFKNKIRQDIKIPETDSSTSSSESSENIVKINNYTTPKYAKELINETLINLVKKIMLQSKNKKGDHSTTTKVTTVRTGEIFTDSHEVTEEKGIIEFTINLYSETLKIFGRIKEKADQDHVKHKIDSLMRSFQDKFKEFVKDRNGQKIKTRLGTQKVILNTIDMSNLLLRRLMNFLLCDLDKKGILRQNTGTANRLQKEIDLELKQQSLNACRKFGICRSKPGFSSFVADALDILLNTDDIKLKQSMDAFTEVIKYMKFPHIFEPETEKKMKIVVSMLEMLDIGTLRALLTVLRNTMKSQNKPFIVSQYSARSNIVNSTLAFLEVIDLLDLLIPPNKDNSLEWDVLKVSLRGFADGKRTDIQEIMTKFLRSFRKKLLSFDEKSNAIISKNLDIILSNALNLFG